LYEFNLTGTVQGSSVPNVAVGDSLAMRFVADSTDLNPDPRLGHYTPTETLMRFPNTVFSEFEPPWGLEVQLRPTSGSYLGGFRVKGEDGFHYTADFILNLGPGLFPSDALPLTLPIPLQGQMLFHLSLGANPNVRVTMR
jgi:hypothetical protein